MTTTVLAQHRSRHSEEPTEFRGLAKARVRAVGNKMSFAVTVARIAQEAINIRSFELAPSDDVPLPSFTAGSHIYVELPNGLTRAYSLLNNPVERTRYRIAVLREGAGRGGSAYMHDKLCEGDSLTIYPPKNNFCLAANATHHIFLAGGIGITPIMSMLSVLERRGESFELHYCTRTAANTAFLKDMRERSFAQRVTFYHDNGDPSRGLDIKRFLKDVSPGAHVYYCGPRGFMRACEEAAGHWPKGAVHFERFASNDAMTDLQNGTFQIEIASTGAILDVPPEMSIADVLQRAGYKVPTLCKEGLCGTCATRVVEGQPDHRDHVLDESERAKGDVVMVCCSRSRSTRLVLGL